MDILFVKPGDAQTNFPHQYAVLSAYIKTFGHSVNFYDASLTRESAENVFEKIDFKQKDAVCISVLTGWHNWASLFTALVKKKYPLIKVIVGGPHISALKEYAVEHIGADYGIAGEGEIALGKLLNHLDNLNEIKNIPGVIYKDGDCYKITPLPYERIKDFNNLPLPDYKLVRPENYFNVYLGASVSKKRFRIVQTVTSRGCPFMCTFCATNATWEKRITFYSAERVIEEIKYLVKDFGVEEIWFGDDGFTNSKKRAIEICEGLIKENIKIPWRIPNGVRLETIDDELASLMKGAGCYTTGVGIETGSKNMMVKIKKRLNLNLINDKVRILKRHGILTSGFFIMGFPDETNEELKETVNFILKSDLERMQICIFNPLPGSEEFNKLFEIENPGKYAENVKRYLYEGHMPRFLRYLDSAMIQKYYRNTLFKFYIKPSVMISLIKHITLRQIRDITLHPGVRALIGLKS